MTRPDTVDLTYNTDSRKEGPIRRSALSLSSLYQEARWCVCCLLLGCPV
ncbi:hypothetical protein CGMCC3_g7699 [Colletotrichum fructicola]|nr:uncharacterized protein CGMCC3_g7699 [Colletotrichum fructicola]KAE9576051.1 hypothetical protein CGMCC3_g7699 [Colletotrichum fructicola]